MNKPAYFYKFVHLDRIDILENGLIRFSPIGSFNDPFELEPTITPISRGSLDDSNSHSDRDKQQFIITEDDITYSTERTIQVEFYKKKYKMEIGKYGVLSLSSNTSINPLLSVTFPEKKDPRTNILMWSHYGDSHKGFVIEFRNDFIDDLSIKKVEYSKERGFLTFEDINENIFDGVFFKKSTEWMYEQEYRAVLPLNKCKKIINDNIYLFKINKSSIKSITLGCAMDEEKKAIIRNIINNDHELNNIPLLHTHLSENGYFLEFYGEYRGLTNNPRFGCVTIPMQKRPK